MLCWLISWKFNFFQLISPEAASSQAKIFHVFEIHCHGRNALWEINLCCHIYTQEKDELCIYVSQISYPLGLPKVLTFCLLRYYRQKVL